MRLFDNCPDEVLLAILLYLNKADMADVSLVNKQFYRVCQDDRLLTKFLLQYAKKDSCNIFDLTIAIKPLSDIYKNKFFDKFLESKELLDKMFSSRTDITEIINAFPKRKNEFLEKSIEHDVLKKFNNPVGRMELDTLFPERAEQMKTYFESCPKTYPEWMSSRMLAA